MRMGFFMTSSSRSALSATASPKIDIHGSEDIWVYARIGGCSNKDSVFGNIYMIPKPCRTPEVRNEFGEAVALTVRRKIAQRTKSLPGIDLPIRVIERLDYIEADDQ